MKYDRDTIPTCAECPEHKGCEKCGIHYCKHFASETDFRFCGNCLADFKVVESVVEKITTYENEQGEVTNRKRQVCKSLHLEGTDWLFAAHKINTLTDEELLYTIEYHRAIVGLMLNERETRRTEHFQKLSKIKINYTPRPDRDETGAIKKSRTKTTTTRQKKEPDQNAIAAAFGTLLGANLTQEQIAVLLAGMKV